MTGGISFAASVGGVHLKLMTRVLERPDTHLWLEKSPLILLSVSNECYSNNPLMARGRCNALINLQLHCCAANEYVSVSLFASV